MHVSYQWGGCATLRRGFLLCPVVQHNGAAAFQHVGALVELTRHCDAALSVLWEPSVLLGTRPVLMKQSHDFHACILGYWLRRQTAIFWFWSRHAVQKAVLAFSVVAPLLLLIRLYGTAKSIAMGPRERLTAVV